MPFFPLRSLPTARALCLAAVLAWRAGLAVAESELDPPVFPLLGDGAVFYRHAQLYALAVDADPACPALLERLNRRQDNPRGERFSPTRYLERELFLADPEREPWVYLPQFSTRSRKIDIAQLDLDGDGRLETLYRETETERNRVIQRLRLTAYPLHRDYNDLRAFYRGLSGDSSLRGERHELHVLSGSAPVPFRPALAERRKRSVQWNLVQQGDRAFFLSLPNGLRQRGEFLHVLAFRLGPERELIPACQFDSVMRYRD